MANQNADTVRTKYDNADKTVLTDDVANMWFGGLYNTTEGNAMPVGHPLVAGHVHDGQHTDGHAQKINLVSHVTGQLTSANLAADAVADVNISSYLDQSSAIPEYVVDGPNTYYKLDLSDLRDEIEDTYVKYQSGPQSPTDNSVPKLDGTTGKIIQASTVRISDTGTLSLDDGADLRLADPGSLFLQNGDIDISEGDILLSDGDITMLNGNMILSDGKAIVGHNNISAGPILDIRTDLTGSTFAGHVTQIVNTNTSGTQAVLRLGLADPSSGSLDRFLTCANNTDGSANGSVLTYIDGNGRIHTSGDIESELRVVCENSLDAEPALSISQSKTGSSSFTDSFVAQIINTDSSSSTHCVLRLGIGEETLATADRFLGCYKETTTTDTIGTSVTFLRGDGTLANTFTGQHWCIYESQNVINNINQECFPGLIYESVGQVWSERVVSQCLIMVKLSKTQSSKKVYGVMSDSYNDSYDIYVWDQFSEKFHTSCSPDQENINPDKYDSSSKMFKTTSNSLGEGLVWVTNYNGNIENGDYITSSAVHVNGQYGYGERQDDDILHSYTVAKSTESIDWDSVTDTFEFEGQTYKKYLIACTYHCG